MLKANARETADSSLRLKDGYGQDDGSIFILFVGEK
jgi:hypothetical protein